MIYLTYLSYYLLGAGAAVFIVGLTQLWLGKKAWTPKTMAWMVFLWPATAWLLAIVFVVFCIIKLATFIAETPRSGWARRLKVMIGDAISAVMEPIVNRIVK